MPTAKKLKIVAAAMRKTQKELLAFMEKQHPEHGMMIGAVRGFFKGKTDAEIYHYIETKVFPSEVQIKTHDLNFFSKNKYHIFEGLPIKYIDIYDELVLTSPKEDLVIYWEFFEKLVGIYELSIRSKKKV